MGLREVVMVLLEVALLVVETGQGGVEEEKALEEAMVEPPS
jgi:hypothetical protein